MKKYLILVFALTFGKLYGNEVWQQSLVNSHYIHSVYNSNILAIFDVSGAGLVSTDKGENWEVETSLNGNFINSIEAHNGKIISLLNNNTIAISSDNAKSWQEFAFRDSILNFCVFDNSAFFLLKDSILEFDLDNHHKQSIALKLESIATDIISNTNNIYISTQDGNIYTFNNTTFDLEYYTNLFCNECEMILQLINQDELICYTDYSSVIINLKSKEKRLYNFIGKPFYIENKLCMLRFDKPNDVSYTTFPSVYKIDKNGESTKIETKGNIHLIDTIMTHYYVNAFDSIIVCIGNNNMIYISKDYGVNWQLISYLKPIISNQFQVLKDSLWLSVSSPTATGRSNMYFSKNHGITWLPVMCNHKDIANVNLDKYEFAGYDKNENVYFINRHTKIGFNNLYGYIFDENGTLISFINSTWGSPNINLPSRSFFVQVDNTFVLGQGGLNLQHADNKMGSGFTIFNENFERVVTYGIPNKELVYFDYIDDKYLSITTDINFKFDGDFTFEVLQSYDLNTWDTINKFNINNVNQAIYFYRIDDNIHIRTQVTDSIEFVGNIGRAYYSYYNYNYSLSSNKLEKIIFGYNNKSVMPIFHSKTNELQYFFRPANTNEQRSFELFEKVNDNTLEWTLSNDLYNLIDSNSSRIIYLNDDLIIASRPDSQSIGLDFVRYSKISSTTSVENQVESPTYLYTYPAYPNPARNQVRAMVYWDLKHDINKAEIEVYDVMGVRVSGKENITITNTTAYNGEIVWDCGSVPEGVYFIKITHGTSTKTVKVAVVR